MDADYGTDLSPYCKENCWDNVLSCLHQSLKMQSSIVLPLKLKLNRKGINLELFVEMYVTFQLQSPSYIPQYGQVSIKKPEQDLQLSYVPQTFQSYTNFSSAKNLIRGISNIKF